MFWYPSNEAVRIVFGTAYVVFLPGFAWTFVFFRRDTIDILERIVLSIGLSIILVPMILFFINSYGFYINFETVFISILGLTILSCVILIILKAYYYLSGKFFP